MLFTTCPKCGNQLAPPGNHCDYCSPELKRPRRSILYALGQLLRAHWLLAAILATGTAGAVCLLAPALGGMILLAIAGTTACWALLRWAGVFRRLSRLAELPNHPPKPPPVAASEVARAGEQKVSGCGWSILILALIVGGPAIQRLWPPDPKLSTNPALAAKIAAQRQSVLGSANEQYWKDAVLRAFQQYPQPIEKTDTISSLLDHEFARQRVNLNYARGRPTAGVDQDLIQAVASWIAAQERFVQWCERNKPLLLDAAEGLSPEKLMASGEMDFMELVHQLSPEQLPPDIAQLHQIAVNLDATLVELDRMQIRLSERYRDRKFPLIGN